MFQQGVIYDLPRFQMYIEVYWKHALYALLPALSCYITCTLRIIYQTIYYMYARNYISNNILDLLISSSV